MGDKKNDFYEEMNLLYQRDSSLFICESKWQQSVSFNSCLPVLPVRLTRNITDLPIGGRQGTDIFFSVFQPFN